MRITTEPHLAQTSVIAWIGLGANLGYPIAQLADARNYLQHYIDIVGASSLYRSAPIDCPMPQNDFFNAVLCARTTLSPHNLLALLLDFEEQMGRTREGYHSPRTLDLDLLLYGSLRHNDVTLTLPHPAIHQRAFVLMPMHELEPNLKLCNSVTVGDALAHVSDQILERYPCDAWQPKPLNTNIKLELLC